MKPATQSKLGQAERHLRIAAKLLSAVGFTPNHGPVLVINDLANELEVFVLQLRLDHKTVTKLLRDNPDMTIMEAVRISLMPPGQFTEKRRR